MRCRPTTCASRFALPSLAAFLSFLFLTRGLVVCIKLTFDGWAACIARDDLSSTGNVYNNGCILVSYRIPRQWAVGSGQWAVGMYKASLTQDLFSFLTAIFLVCPMSMNTSTVVVSVRVLPKTTASHCPGTMFSWTSHLGHVGNLRAASLNHSGWVLITLLPTVDLTSCCIAHECVACWLPRMVCSTVSS